MVVSGKCKNDRKTTSRDEDMRNQEGHKYGFRCCKERPQQMSPMSLELIGCGVKAITRTCTVVGNGCSLWDESRRWKMTMS
jgi:hypothetical protein